MCGLFWLSVICDSAPRKYNKEKRKVYDKAYREQNKEKAKHYAAEYRYRKMKEGFGFAYYLDEANIISQQNF